MSAAVTTAHLATAGRIIGENSTYTPDCGRVLYKEAQGDIAQALADLEAATEARVRAELATEQACAVPAATANDREAGLLKIHTALCDELGVEEKGEHAPILTALNDTYNLAAAEAGKAPGGKAEDFGYPDPTEADLADPSFEAVWQAIKGWDVSREPGTHRMYAGTTGNDVMRILAALRAEAGKAQAEWVPVSERLPTKCTLVLVYEPGWVEPAIGHYDGGVWLAEDDDDDQLAVTHWMPLPTVPSSAPEGT